MMLHTKWNGQDKYSYSSHVSYTGTLEYKSGHQYWKQTSFSDLGYCCRIFPTVELSEPRMVRTLYNETGEWVLPEYSKKSKNNLRPVHLLKSIFFKRKSFGNFTRHDVQTPRMALRMASCFWWMLSLLKMPNIPGEPDFHSHGILMFGWSPARRRVWLSPSLETLSGRWSGRVAPLLRRDRPISSPSRLTLSCCFDWLFTLLRPS